MKRKVKTVEIFVSCAKKSASDFMSPAPGPHSRTLDLSHGGPTTIKPEDVTADLEDELTNLPPRLAVKRGGDSTTKTRSIAIVTAATTARFTTKPQFAKASRESLAPHFG